MSDIPTRAESLVPSEVRSTICRPRSWNEKGAARQCGPEQGGFSEPRRMREFTSKRVRATSQSSFSVWEKLVRALSPSGARRPMALEEAWSSALVASVEPRWSRPRKVGPAL